MKNFRVILAGIAFLFAVSAWAADLDSAKAQGLIGEREDGYLGFVVAAPGADVVALVNDINDKRRAEYERIAARNGIGRTDVEVLAGRKAIERTSSGGYVFSGGRWSRK